MADIDYHASCGFALELLAKSAYHSQFELGNMFRSAILPPLWANQARFYLTSEGIPTALVTWAWLSKDVEAEVHASGRDLAQDEWQCGDRLYFSDWITPYGNIRDVTRDMGLNVFPDHTATSLRRNADGTIRRVCRWTGGNVRKTQQEDAQEEMV